MSFGLFNLGCFLLRAPGSSQKVLQIFSNPNSALGFITDTDLVLDYSIVSDKLLYRELLIQLTVSIRLSTRKLTCAL